MPRSNGRRCERVTEERYPDLLSEVRAGGAVSVRALALAAVCGEVETLLEISVETAHNYGLCVQGN